MSSKSIRERVFRYVLLLGGLMVLLLAVSFGAALAKFDFGRIFERAGWQLPDRVIASIELKPGVSVADIGAGDGYFTFRFADVVGPTGRVYAVDVVQDIVGKLQEKVRTQGRVNVEVVLGELDDPLLPEKEIDLAFLCNTYHHIEGRPTYFRRLKESLTREGRVAVIDVKDSLLVRLFVPHGHWTTEETIRQEMKEAGYRYAGSFDFLPAQNFLLFSVEDP